jgi:hypothetical protein
MIATRSLRSPSGWLTKRLASGSSRFPHAAPQPRGRFMWSGRDTMPLLELFRPERPKALFQIPPTTHACECRVSSLLHRRNADKMSSRVKKTKSKPAASTLRANHLLAAILSADDLLTMRPCSTCAARGLDSCEVSKTDSSRCAECVRAKRLNCDVLGVSPAQLRTLASQH